MKSLVGIATALREDQRAVAQGVTPCCNSGVNEGRITGGKLQKRIMAGRAASHSSATESSCATESS
ncbi:hypothetical protein [Streptomyces sp. NWU339]|uniref:hypothetical protein n=1 Tax=Streptomyces sp. NWU339 TaxID=2185284 RepID=UPI001C638E7F|nr:hypothetical protein [Streptomyces sp. NWU339]